MCLTFLFLLEFILSCLTSDEHSSRRVGSLDTLSPNFLDSNGRQPSATKTTTRPSGRCSQVARLVQAMPTLLLRPYTVYFICVTDINHFCIGGQA
ncbi:hypothetical protein AcW1_006940 [Taiwanofungus camphoratus]|nr:hypothetical protein AcW1_006940 [Antrodia cinnamomea]